MTIGMPNHQPPPPLPTSSCCGLKSVGGISYSLLREGETPKDYHKSCIYKSNKQLDYNEYCFAPGDLPSICNSGIFAHTYPRFITSKSFGF